MSYVLGLTGSIGMGKSTTARILAEMGLPVWDADAVVHRLYATGGAGVALIARICPKAVSGTTVDRAKLRAAIAEDPALLARVQAAIHPLVAADRAEFLATALADIVVLDIPLLFEIGADALCNGVLVVTNTADVQRARVMQRGIGAQEFESLLARQMPDAEKRARATWIVFSTSLDAVRRTVGDILAEIRNGKKHA